MKYKALKSTIPPIINDGHYDHNYLLEYFTEATIKLLVQDKFLQVLPTYNQGDWVKFRMLDKELIGRIVSFIPRYNDRNVRLDSYMMITEDGVVYEEPEQNIIRKLVKVKFWINLYKNVYQEHVLSQRTFDSEEEAKNNISYENIFIKTIKVSYFTNE